MDRPISPKSRTVALVLCFFFGALGIHRIYVGKLGSGTTMIIVSLTMIGLLVTGVWAFVDMVVIACGQFRDAEGQLISNW
jgi:TM2 domain-containing membrane protein YozV